MKINLNYLSAFVLVISMVGETYSQEERHHFLTPAIIEEPWRYYHYSAHARKFTGISSMAVSPNGRIWATWYAGTTPGEDKNNYIVLASSTDHGASWDEILVVDPDRNGPVRAFDPEVWLDPEGKLWLFWAQTVGHDGTVAGVWAMTASDLDSPLPKWTAPERLTDGVMMCKPIVRSDGEWLLPVSTWRLTDASAKVVSQAPSGDSWHVLGSVNVPKEVRSYDEHMVVEKQDRSLWMLVRTNYGIGESTSHDGGRNWSDLRPSKIQHTDSRFFISRVQSGNLLLVKHGPIEQRTGRSHLMAFLSEDDGATWSKGLLLDERTGVSYPDGQQAADGTIYITYDYNRTGEQQVFMTKFTEADIRSADHDQAVVNVFRNRRKISEGGH